MVQKDDKFLQPVISVLGLGVSIISLLLPLFTKEGFTKLFINQNLSLPISFIAFVLGIVIIWQITELQSYIDISFGPLINKGGYKAPLIKIGSNGLVWIILICNVVTSYIFISIYLNFHQIVADGKSKLLTNINLVSLMQGYSYLLFFLGLITIFSILLTQTRQKFKWADDQENLIQIITGTLENNGIIQTGIKILENRQLSQTELTQYGLFEPLLRKIIIKTINQEEKTIECVISSDGKQLKKVLS